MSYHVYVKDGLDAITPEELNRALASLPGWRRELALRFRHERGRRECAFSYLLLCRALQEVYGIMEQPAFVYGEHGKPSLVGVPDVHFSLSHCRQAVVCAVSDRPVGIDVEGLGRFKPALARHVLCPDEYRRVVTADNPDLLFTRFWTQKEAIVKLTGRGIDDDLKNLLFKYNNVCLHTSEHLAEGYVVSVAGEGV